MEDPGDERSAVLLVRVWLEGNPPGLRARISGSPGTAGMADQPIATASTRAAVAAVVRGWLEGFTASGRAEFWNLLTESGDEAVTQP